MINGWHFTILLTIFIKCISSVRVCETFEDYLDPNSEFCENNPDGESNVTQILENWGCTVKEHYITTDDGYIILVVQANKNVSKSTPIVMVHGVLMNSLGYVGKYNKTIAYHLIENGYRIFLVNVRGTRYSTGHVNLTQSDRSYWKFSFHEMAVYDLRNTLDLVFTLTNQKSIIIGYSMGTTITTIYTSTFLDDATAKLKGTILMAPVTGFNFAISILKWLAPSWMVLKPFIEALWNGRVFPINEGLNAFCASGPARMFICETLKFPIAGEDYDQMDPWYLPVTNLLYNDATGINVIDHFVQVILSGSFRQFDHGPERNKILYGSTTPPDYKLSKIKVPTALFVGSNDWLASSGDALALSIKIPGALCGLTYLEFPKWNHIDFMTAKDLNEYLNEPVMAKIAEMENEKCHWWYLPNGLKKFIPKSGSKN